MLASSPQLETYLFIFHLVPLSEWKGSLVCLLIPWFVYQSHFLNTCCAPGPVLVGREFPNKQANRMYVFPICLGERPAFSIVWEGTYPKPQQILLHSRWIGAVWKSAASLCSFSGLGVLSKSPRHLANNSAQRHLWVVYKVTELNNSLVFQIPLCLSIKGW